MQGWLDGIKAKVILYCIHLSPSLQFLAFDTEASHDILKVWDGPPENEMSLKEVSGSLLPEGIHSTLNVVTIQFETDFYITKSGFAIDFSSEYFMLSSWCTVDVICLLSVRATERSWKVFNQMFYSVYIHINVGVCIRTMLISSQCTPKCY